MATRRTTKGTKISSLPAKVQLSLTEESTRTWGTGPFIEPPPVTSTANPPTVSPLTDKTIKLPGDLFYATGSSVDVAGIGFQQPLWDKTKIEIDLTPSARHTVQMVPTGSKANYPMMYWNKDRGLYEGIGTGTGVSGSYSYDDNLNGIRAYLDEQTLGFGASQDSTLHGFNQKFQTIYARQISSFGFPGHQKFQPTGSQQLSMAQYISEPFLLEKIVFEVSASLNLYPSPFRASGTPPVWTFFLLNSRTNISGSPVGSQTVALDQVSTPSFTTSSISNGHYLDVVDYFQVAFTGSVPGHGGEFKTNSRELLVQAKADAGATMTFHDGQLQVSSTVKSSISYDGVYAVFTKQPDGTSARFFRQQLSISGRNSLTNVNGRDWVSSFERPQVVGIANFPYGPDSGATPVNSAYTKPNPYVLLPTDKLTIGCQLPWSLHNIDFSTLSSSITFAPAGVNKITLYGSPLRVNPETNQIEEYHSGLEMSPVLCTTNVAETIGNR